MRVFIAVVVLCMGAQTQAQELDDSWGAQLHRTDHPLEVAPRHGGPRHARRLSVGRGNLVFGSIASIVGTGLIAGGIVGVATTDFSPDDDEWFGELEAGLGYLSAAIIAVGAIAIIVAAFQLRKGVQRRRRFRDAAIRF